MPLWVVIFLVTFLVIAGLAVMAIMDCVRRYDQEKEAEFDDW